MAYLAREDSIKEWASLVTGQQVASLKKILETEFAIQLLISLDSQYFQPILSEAQTGPFSQVLSEMRKYYSKIIGTNISHLMGDSVNLYSSKTIEEVWQLILGIAIKGRARENNINKILNMQSSSQEELMRVISKVIAKFGDNVSGILDEQASPEIYGMKDSNLLMELSEENEQLREEMKEQASEIKALKEKRETVQKELEDRKKEKTEITNILCMHSSQFSNIFSQKSASLSALPDFIRDLIYQVNKASKELSKREEHLNHLEEVNREIKLAYSGVLVELESVRIVSKEASSDITHCEKELEKARAEVEDMLTREKDLTSKIEQLEEQKYYLKGIVQRFQKNHTISQQKIDILIKQKQEKLEQLSLSVPQEDQGHRGSLGLNGRERQAGENCNSNNKTVKHEIDEINEPMLRNKLQREVSHLQKKVNALQQQNHSLRKINGVLESTIYQFTEDSGEALKQCEQEFEPLYEELRALLDSQTLEKEQLGVLVEAIKSKIKENDTHNLMHLQVIRKLELERDQLINTIKSMQQLGQLKPALAGQAQTQSPQYLDKKSREAQIRIEEEPPQPRDNTNNPPQQIVGDHSNDGTPTKIVYSIIDDGEEDCNRRGQYSFMANRVSAYKMGSEINIKIREAGSQNQQSFIDSPARHEGGNSLIQQRRGEGSGSDLDEGELFDITQLEEGLEKVKERFLAINEKSKKLYENYVMKSKNEGQKDKDRITNRDGYKELISAFQQSSAKEIEEKGYHRDAGVFSPELVRLHQENKVLRRQISCMISERSKLSKMGKQEDMQAEAQASRVKIEHLNQMLQSSQGWMEEAEQKHLELYQFFTQIMDKKEAEATVEALRTQLEESMATCHNQADLIHHLGQELTVLSSAFLEVRNRVQL